MIHQPPLFADPVTPTNLLIGPLFDVHVQGALERSRKLLMLRSGAHRPARHRLHLTLQCIEVHPTRVASVKQALAEIRVPQMTLTFRRVDHWRDCAVMLPDAHEVLHALHDGIIFQLLRVGLRVDGHWTPHVTLAYEIGDIKLRREVPAIQCQLDNFLLIDSRFTPKVEHKVLARYPLVSAHPSLHLDLHPRAPVELGLDGRA